MFLGLETHPFTPYIYLYVAFSVFLRSLLLFQGHKSLYLASTLVAQLVKNLPAMLETWVQSLGWEDTLENGMATHSSNLACRIPWTEESAGLEPTGCKELDITKVT